MPVGKSKFAQWAIKVPIAHLRIETNTRNLIWSDSDRQFLLCVVYKVQNAKKQQFRALGQVKICPMGN